MAEQAKWQHNRQKLFDGLKEEGFSGFGNTVEEFGEKLNKENNRATIYNTLKSYGYKGIGDSLDDFTAKVMPPTEVQHVSPQVLAERLAENQRIVSDFNRQSAARGRELSADVKAQNPRNRFTDGSRESMQYNPNSNKLEATYTLPTGERTFSKTDATLKRLEYNGDMGLTATGQLRQAQKRLAEYEDKLDARAEILMREHERTKESLPGFVNVLSDIGNAVRADKMGGNTGNTPTYDYAEFVTDPEYNALLSSIRDTEKQIRQLENWVEKEKHGERFWHDFGRGVLQEFVLNPDVWDFGRAGFRQGSTLANISNKLNNNEELTESEKNTLNDLYLLQNVQSEFGDLGTGARWGSIAGQSLSFMKDFALSGPISGGVVKGITRGLRQLSSNAVKSMGIKAAEKASAQILKEGLPTYLATNLATRAATKAGVNATSSLGVEVAEKGLFNYLRSGGSTAAKKLIAEQGVMNTASIITLKALGTTAEDLLIRAPLMATTIQGLTTGANIINTKLGPVVFNEETGELQFADDKTWGEAAWQSGMDAVVENMSEMAGAHAPTIVDMARVFGARRLAAGILRTTREGAGTVLSNVNKFLKQAGVNGYLSEVGEEYYGQGWRTLLNLESAYTDVDGERKNLISDSEWHADLWGGIGLTIGLTGAASVSVAYPARGAYNMSVYLKHKHNVRKADKKASKVFSPEQWEPIKEYIDASDNGNVSAIIGQAFKDNNLTAEQKEAITNYTWNLLIFRGYNLGEMLLSRNGLNSANNNATEAQNSYLDGYTADAGERNAISIALDLQRNKLLELTTPEVVAEVEADPIGALSKLGDDPDVNQAVIDFVNAKQTDNGMSQRLIDNLDDAIEESNATVDSCVNRSTGMVEEAILNSNVDNKNNVYVISGNLVANEDYTIDTDKSDNSIIVRDAETGIVSMISPNDILSIFPPVDPNEVKLRTEEALRKLYAQRTANNVSGTVFFTQGDTYTITDAEGNETQIQVFPNADGIIDNGDGTVNVSADGGNTIVAMNKEGIQSMVDLTNRNRVAQQIAETDAKRVEESITQWRDRFGDDLQAGTSFNILYDGKPVTITITEISNNGIIYYTDNNGEDWQEGIASLFKERSDYEDYVNGNLIPSVSYHIGDTIEAWGDNGRRTTGRLVAESPDGGFEVEFDSPVRGSMVAVLPTEEIQAMDLNATSSPIAAEAEGDIETSEPPSPAEPTALSRIPRGDDGELMYEAADADTAWDAIVEEAGDEAMAKRVVDSMVADKEAALKKAEKQKPRAGTTPSEKIAAERERMTAIDNARSVLDHWKRIALVPLNRKADENARLRREAEEAAKARREAEAAERRQREEAARIEREMLGGVPDMVDDKASDARARGYRRVNGHVVERQAEVPRLLGKESRVKFSDRDIPVGNWAIIDASQLQPSHIDGRRNPLHFLDEAQPKERKEADSVAAARRMAGNIRAEEITGGATAYSGSPTVNTRGEVIQGNNRSAALREMWQSHPQEAARYKQYLAEHADGFGFSPEAIENMGQPVLVNMLDVSDSKAIELGQFVASDTETGGIERIRPKNTVQKLGGDMGIFASKLLQGGDEEASFSQLLDTNGQEALRWMNSKGIITDTQYRSAFAPNGSLTGEAKNDLRGIMLQGIFQDSITQLETMFEALPAKAQKAILATMWRDFDSPESDRILPEVQMSIQAYYALSHFEAFANAKNYKEARIAAETWRMQYAFDDATGESYLPSERFSNFALLLASAYKAQTQRLLQGAFNRIFDLVQGRQEETLFEKPDNTPLPLAEAIDETIKEFNLANNFRYDGQIRSDVLGGNSPRSREGRRGSGGNAPAGERSEDGEQSPDSAGGTGGNFENAKTNVNEKESLNLQNGQNPQENEIPERISQKKRGTQNARDARMAEVADEIARGGRLYEKEHGGSRTVLPGLFAQQRAAEQIAKENGYWIPMQEIASLGLPGPSGNENDTYVSGNTIYKVNNLLNSGSILKLFERIQTYNSLFPESNYEFIGFTGFDGRSVFPVFSQELVKNAVFASTSEIDDYMDTLGFRKTGEGRYENDVYEVWDVLPKNVLKSASGNIYVVDAEIRLAKSTEQNQTLGEKVSQAEAETDANPTDGQKEAGNYKKGHVRVGAFDITIEKPKGSVRSGVDANGKPWQTTMNNTYGYMRGTEGVDGDHIDVFLSDNLDGWDGQNVFVVDQYNEDGTFDEHKVMLGFNDEAEAQDAYFSNYEKGWGEKRKLVCTPVTIDEFEKWIGSSRRKTKPFAEYKGVNKEASQPIGQADTSDTAASGKENGAAPRQDSLFADTGDNAQAKQKDAAEKLHERYEQAYAEALKKARREKGKDVDEDAVRNLVDFNYEGDLYMDAERILNELMGGKGETLSDDMFEWEMEAGNGNEDGIPSLPQIIDEIARRESGNSMLFQKTGEIVVPTAKEAALRDAIVERLRQSGLEVITDAGAGQRMIDLASGQGEQVRTQAMIDGLEKAANFIAESVKGKKRNQRITIELPSTTIRKIRNVLGRNFDSHNITANSIIHAKKNHGIGGNKITNNSIPLRDEDFSLAPYIMTAPDVVEKGSMDASGRESIRFKKNLSNGYAVVVEKEQKNSPDDMETITMWAELSSSNVSDARTKIRPLSSTSQPANEYRKTNARTVIISSDDAAKIRKNAEDAIKADAKLREHRVFHGSGADFDRFDHSHMGEGEGAQAYGWGTYVTEVEGIGKSYAMQKRGRISYKGHSIGEIQRLYNEGASPYSVVLSVVEKMELGYSFEEAKADLESEWKNALEYDEREGNKLYAEGWKKNLSELAMLHGNDFQVNNSRHLYTVEIPDDNGSNYLEYGNPLPETLDKEAMAEAVFRRILETDEDGSYNDDTAREMLRRDLSDSFGEAEDGETLYGTIAAYLGDKGASVFLHGLGFVGISYPAEYRSGGRKDKAKNYVIFNEDDLQIVDKARFFRTPRGEAYGFTIGGRIYIDPRIASAETPIHEYSHLWASALRHGNAGEWRNVVGLMKGTPAWEETKSRYPELATDDEIADEVLATYSGRRGAERLREQQRKIAGGRGAVVGKAETIAALEQVKEALRRFWKAVADFLHISFSTAEEVADRVMSDLLEGVNPARTIEEQSIIDRAKADGTYMKAPNGKPTNLTERQWAQVRTRAFKQWFGDWEKAARIEKLRKSEPVVVSGNDYQGKYELNSKSAEDYIVNSLRGEYANKDTGDIINVTRASRKVAHHDAENDIHLKSIAYIPQMIENAIFIDEVPNEKGTKFDSYRYYVVGLTIDGADYTAKLVVGRKNGGSYYDHALTEIEKNSLLNLTDGVKADVSDKETVVSGIKDKRLVSILQTNSSKVVDENGEPRVVYHGTTKGGFSEFNSPSKSKVAQKTEAPENSFWFVSERDKARSYSGKDADVRFESDRDWQNAIYPVFLNMKNPLVETFEGEYWDYRPQGGTTNDVAAEAREKGHDGAIIQDVVDEGEFSTWENGSRNDTMPMYAEGATDYVVFSPNQIKSATENTGAFSADNEDIRFSLRNPDDLLYREQSDELAEVKDHIEDIFNDAVSGRLTGKPVPIGKLTSEGKAYLENISGLKMKDDIDFVLNPSDLVHIYKKHFGKNEKDKRRNIPLSIDDIRNLSDVVSSPDRIIFFKEGDGSNRNMFYFFKGSEDGTYNLMEIYSDKKGNLTAKTFYKTRKDAAQRVMEINNSLLPTSGTYFGAILSDAKIPKIFDLPNIQRDSFRKGNGALDDDGLSMANDPRARLSGKPTRTARQRREFAERERRRMAERVSALAEKLHLGNVEIVTDLSGLQGKRKEAKGFFSRSTGRITIVVPNHASAFDAEQTLLHEAVGHYGLRRLFGDHFDTFLDNVYQNADEDVRRRIAGLSAKHGWDFRTATEEYLALLAEDTDFENVNASWWQKIKSFFLEMLRKIGFEGFTGVTLSDNELRYLLWRSYENLAEPGRYRGILEEAADIATQMRLKVGNYAIGADAAQRVAENSDLLYRNGEDVTLGLADRYQKKVTSKAGEVAEAYQDNMRSVRILQEEIAKETGRPIADFENAYDRENHENSINKIEQEQYIREIMKPTEKVLAKIQLRKWKNGEFITFDEIEKYLIAKHGLERNPKFARRDADAIYTETKEELDKNLKDGKIAKERYNEKLSEAKEKREKNFAKFRERDYSGLTALFSGGNPNMPVEQLEEAAQKYVDDFESAVAYRDKEKEDRVNSIAKGYTNLADELWELIRKSKEFTLNKQYKTGLINAELRDRLMNMFDYYVPLRGFADETAGDLYKYQPTDRASKSKNTKLKQQKAEGRTSQAGNILATMMQMAGLSITAGNRNYTNQALLNLALNHPTNLLTVSGLYYMQEKGTGKWMPVYPEISEDMSAEERQKAVSDFESRCKEVIAKEKALPLKDKTIVRMEKGLLLPIRMDAWQKQQHSVRVQRGGEEYVVFVNGDPRAAEALNGLLYKRALEWAARFTRWVSANVTSRNPEFLVSNAARDFQSAVTTILVDSGYEEGYLNKFLTNYHNNFSPIAFRGARKGHYNGIYALYRKYEKGELDMNNERERYFKEFLENGGETGYTQLWQIDKLDKELKNMTKLQKGGFDEAVAFTKQALTATNNVIEFANRGIENATRFSAYMTSRQMGKSVLSSINDAKDISVNFNRHGSGALGYAYFKSLFMFLNPAIQGLAKEIRLFRGDPAKASLFFIGIPIALGALVPFAMMLLADGGDPEDYFGLTAHTRQNNLVLGFNGNYIKIPLPPELRAFYGVGEAIASHTLNDKQHGNMGLEIANSLSQLFPRDIVDAGGLIDSEHSLLTGVIKGITPDMIKTPLEAFVWNENFAGYPITSQYDWNASYPEYLRSDKNTPKWMIETSKFVNESTGGTARRRGWADSEYMNPSAIEHITTSYLGGMFTFGMKMGKTIAMIWDEEMRDSRNVPVVSRLYQHVDAGAALKRYYNEMSILYANECETDKAEFNYYYNQEGKGIFDKAFIVSEEMQQNKFKRWIIAEPHIKRINELRREYNKQRAEGDTANLEKTETELQQAKKEFVDKMDAFDSTMEIDPFAYNKDVRLYKIDLEYKSMNQKLNELKEDSSTSDIMDRAAQIDALYNTDDYRRYMIVKQYKRVISNVQREIEKSKDADQRAALEKEVSRLQDEMIKEIDKPQN